VIVASQQGDDNYAEAPTVSQSFTIGQTSQTITFNKPPYQQMGTGPHTLVASASSGLPVSFTSISSSICTVSADQVTLVAPGTCSITASQVGNANYSPAPQVTQTFSIGKAAVIIVLSPTLPDGDQGVAYSATVTASGGAEPYTFAVTSGALPPGLTLNPASGTVSGTPTGNGTFGFTITANDGASNTGSQAYTIMIGTGFIEQRTAEVNRNFLQHRADMVTSQEPGRVHNFRRLGDSLMGGNGGSGAQMLGGGGVPFNLGMTPNADGGVSKVTFSTSLQQMLQAKRSDRFSADGTGRMALGGANSSYSANIENQNFDFWVEGHLSFFDYDTAGTDGGASLVYVGADYLVRPWLLVGGLVQFDRVHESTGKLGSSVKGVGWMAGPYFAARLSPSLFLDGRVAWGRSENRVSPFGTYTDTFDTERWLAKTRLTGIWDFEQWRFTPGVEVAYFEDKQESYVDSNGLFIPGQKVTLGRVTVGPEFAYRFHLADGSLIEPLIRIESRMDFASDNVTLVDGVAVSRNHIRARVEAGVRLMKPWGYTLRTTGSIDGLGDDGFKAYGGQIWINMPLN